MERVTLHTDLPELTNDLCDVIRLFLGECEINEEPGGSLSVVHTMGQEHVVTVGDARAVAAVGEPDGYPAHAAVLRAAERGLRRRDGLPQPGSAV